MLQHIHEQPPHHHCSKIEYESEWLPAFEVLVYNVLQTLSTFYVSTI